MSRQTTRLDAKKVVSEFYFYLFILIVLVNE